MATEYMNEDGDVIEIPLKWEICPDCGGKGGSSAHLGVLTPSEWDRDELDGYFAGHYDKSCSYCDGTGKVEVPDRAALTAEQLKLVDDQDRHDHDCQMEMESERRMGC